MLLAIDTATRTAGLALYDEEKGRVLGEETWHSVNNHTVELTPRLVGMLEQQGCSPVDLTGLVVSLGPGSFTGLRIGLGVAKGLALSLGIPLVGIPTLDIVARPHKGQRLPIWAILQAGRSRICVGHYVRRRGRWRRHGEYRLTTLQQLCEEEQEPALFCGEIESADARLIRESLGSGVSIATPAFSLRRAAHLAELGWERLAKGDVDNAASLAPIYLQTPAIHA